MDAPMRLLVIAVLVAALLAGTATATRSAPLIVNHTSTDLSAIPASAVANASANLHIAYGHTSHGSQLISGMAGLADPTTFTGAPLPSGSYAFNDGGTDGALDVDDYFVDGDLGNPDFSTWASRTRTYLSRPENHDVNVVMWSWCGQVSWASEADITTYLSLMDGLEQEFDEVTFVYMTGHLDGTDVSGNLNLRNNQIRDWCRSHNRVLYDFADIESYDPDGNGYLALGANDACDYNGGNWALAWQNSHTEKVDWYRCDPAHTQHLNGNLKAYAAWQLFARLAGWGAAPTVTVTATPTPAITPATIPGVVEAEDYASGGEGVAYHDTEAANLGGAYRTAEGVDIESLPGGGYSVAYIRNGEWLGYTVAPNRTAVYRLSARVASPNAMARMEVSVDGAPAFTIAVPNTGDYESFAEAEASEQVRLTAGSHNLTVGFPVGYMNLDCFTVLAVRPVGIQGGDIPLDADGDGLYEDANGNGRADFADVVLFFNQMSWIAANEPVAAFDFNANGRLDFADVVWLFNHL